MRVAAPAITDPNPAPAPAVDPAPSPAPAAVSDPLAKPVRPEWFGKPFDGYWADDKGVDHEKLTTDFEALTALKAAADERAKGVPEKIEDYEVALPEGFEVPQGITLSFDKMAEDPVVKAVLPEIRQFAKDNNLTKDQFKGLVALKAKFDLAEHGEMKRLAGEQKAALGTKAEARVGAVVTWLQGKLGNEHANVLMPMMFTAKQIEAFEKVIAVAGGGSSPPGGGGRETRQPAGISEDDWAKMSPTQRIDYGRKKAA